ncbi:MAG TPA: GH92 family glycosyl hydrolase [Pseudomonadota bacterium]|nr:GH92 family glycosyl hydrolase [Pseudomonadota bacterium]
MDTLEASFSVELMVSVASARRAAWRASLALLLPLVACGAPEPASVPPAPAPPPLTRVEQALGYADPFIGSGGFGFRDGSAFPGAAAPHGLAKVGPDTRGEMFGTVRFLHFIGYWYDDNVIQGFSHLHLHGTGAPDYGVLSVMPLVSWDPAKLTVEQNESPFQKKSEVATPGYYAVTLDHGPVRAELTATRRAAHHRFTYDPAGSPPGTPRSLLFDLGKHLESGEITDAEITVDKAAGRLRGRLHSKGGMTDGYGGYEVYFAARTRSAWSEHKVWSDGTPPAAADHAQGTGVGLVLTFPAPPSGAAAPIELQVAVSLVSAEYAEKSLAAELPEWDFEGTRKQTAAAWQDLLGVARVTGGSDSERRMFYSALYRSFLMPTVHSESDGTYRGFDGTPQNAQGFQYVSDLSLWDTYRTLHPLYSLLAPERALDVVKSLHAMALNHGAFPKWPLAGGDSGCMIGAPAEFVVADSYLKGLTGFDAAGAYDILRAAAMNPLSPAGGRGGREHADLYMKYGYVPAQIGGSVSRTTEYARGDFALAELAQALGKTEDAAELHARARSYTQLYDPSVGFLRARKADGSFPWNSFSPEAFSSDYTEANAWQSLLMNDHDPAGLAAMLGGTQQLLDKLTAMFEATRSAYEAEDHTNPTLGADRPPYYWQGNESDIHVPYLFAQLGRPELTQRWVRFVMQTQYSDRPAGLPGNDDGGAMSAWYIFSALGLYPIVGSDRYVLSIPQFPRVELNVRGGVFTIEAVTAAGEPAAALLATGYVQSVTLDGRPLTRPELRHADLKPGSTLRFVIGEDAVSWGQPSP